MVSKALNVPIHEISDDSNSENTSGWDSLAIMQLLVSIEDEYGFRISINEVNFLKSISGIEKLILNSQNASKKNF